jgi:hypothetical protein
MKAVKNPAVCCGASSKEKALMGDATLIPRSRLIPAASYRAFWLFPIIIGVVLAAFATPNVSFSDSSGWETVGDGIQYKEFILPGPNHVFVARMEISNPNAIIESSIGQGILMEGKETVSGMAARYDQALNPWGGDWGPRNHVVVAINGSFHDPITGEPWGGVIQSGWYAKRYGDLVGSSGFVWTADRTAFVGGCVTHRPEKQVLNNLTTGKTINFDKINIRPKSNRITIYTPQFGSMSDINMSNVEVLVEVTRPAGIYPLPARVTGVVKDIWVNRGAFPIPFDHIAIAAGAGVIQPLLQTVNVGDVIAISSEVTDLGHDCKNASDIGWTKAYSSVAGSYDFLQNGEVVQVDDEGALVRHPRTAVCLNDNFVFFVVVDGRRDSYSIGMTIEELGSFCKNHLDATSGINHDGGGSSTMWVNGEIVNRPSDGSERAVANGLMMVNVEAIEKSTTFRVGDKVHAIRPANIYLGPGTNYTAITSVPQDTPGFIHPYTKMLNGVLAKSRNWWYVDFGWITGWVDESALEKSDSADGEIHLDSLRLEN